MLAAMATMRRFANQPGRKVMLLLAGGWPRSVEIFAKERLPDGGLLPVDRRVMSEHELYGPLVSTANLIGFSLYPVDLPASKETSTATQREGSAPTPNPTRPARRPERFRRKTPSTAPCSCWLIRPEACRC